jgi:pyridoxal phosphate enzyme (YggS family)
VPDSIKTNLSTVRTRVAQACLQSERNPDSVTLLAVSKTKPVEMIEAAINNDQYHFGENYLQDAIAKIPRVTSPHVIWHFIGSIQSNKTRDIAESFDWVHTVASMKVARRLNNQRPTSLPPLNILLQVNIDNETSKSGLLADEVHQMIEELNLLDRIRLRGLMAIPSPSTDSIVQRSAFRRLRKLLESIQSNFELEYFDQLSMGMSSDLEAAIAEGATIVRIGTAIFGTRN